ncbi:TPM domain-containing protein [Candidatus Woesearchaeota archaeon]|nr:MAG: TPM domain-containing protein [Candidatus Woesearchaeota archaeon]
MRCRALLALVLLLSANSFAQEIKGFVNDYANVLSPSEESDLEIILRELYDSGRAQYSVVTIKSLEGEDIEGKAHKLAEGVLGEREKNNGLLLLVAIEDRKYRFEVGRGLEAELPDIIVGRIGREYLVPAFRKEQYGEGIIRASKAISAILSGELDSNQTSRTASRLKSQTESYIRISWIAFIAILFLFLFFAQYRKRKRSRPDDSDYLIAAWVLSDMLRGSGRGGGFGGFGGGSFGGGGASGGW